jgi:hypothetical protein
VGSETNGASLQSSLLSWQSQLSLTSSQESGKHITGSIKNVGENVMIKLTGGRALIAVISLGRTSEGREQSGEKVLTVAST